MEEKTLHGRKNFPMEEKTEYFIENKNPADLEVIYGIWKNNAQAAGNTRLH